MSDLLTKGSVVIDATCGNGNDSVFIAKKIGPTGKLYCFDIQEIAIINTQNKLGLLTEKPQIIYLNVSHENFSHYIHEQIDVFFYNLGYLPSFDKTITTKAETTITSLNSAFSLLRPHGIVSLMIYREHDSNLEYNAIKEYLSTLDNLKFSIAETNFILRKASPALILIEKL